MRALKHSELPWKTRVYFRIREYKLIKRYLRRLRDGDDLRLTNASSKESYEAYDDSEQRAYETGSVRTLQDGIIKRVTFREIREAYLSEIYLQLDELIASKEGGPVRILEVGCGNCINAMRLLDRYRDKIKYSGFDLSPQRIEVSKQYWGDRLNGAEFSVMSATDIGFADNSFDLVFSMHVLEQISYLVGQALDEMLRVSANRIVFVEPTYEFGLPAQRLKLTLNDQLRTLLPELESRNVNILKSYPCKTLANPTNPTGIHVIKV